MSFRYAVRIALAMTAATMALAGCDRRQPTEVWPPIIDPVVFDDTFGANVQFQAFLGSKLDAVAIDSTVAREGRASMRITVPAPGDPSGGYAGGALVTSMERDLSRYSALGFWVKASRAVILEKAGFGNNNAGTSLHEAVRANIPMTTDWTQVFVPIPLATKLRAEDGLFFFAEGPQGGAGLTIWIDDLRFVDIGPLARRAFLTPQTINTLVGASLGFEGATRTVVTVNGANVLVSHSPRYFTFVSSNPEVAQVSGGSVRVVGGGSATITAMLDTAQVTGAITVNAVAPPTVAAPTPTLPASQVISLYGNAYPSVPVTTWSPNWDGAEVADVTIAGNAAKLYTNLGYAAVEFPPLDASAMSHFHLDVWAPSGTTFKVKLVDFGADGAYDGGDDTEHELTFDESTTPRFAAGSWASLEIPMASFANLLARGHLAQLILSGNASTVYLDNVYFHQ